MDYTSLIHHLLDEQCVNMLDRTKCSTTACNIYNYLTSEQTQMVYNNNLVDVSANWSTFAAALVANGGTNTVYYIHLDHITGETSHYFILCQLDTPKGKRILILQSAVFEFSIADWLFPDAAEREAREEHATATGALDPTDEPRYSITRRQHDADLAEREAILQRIRDCKWSSGRDFSTEEFIAEFIPGVAALEGEWTVERLPELCATYQQFFSCFLKPGQIRGRIRTGSAKPAVFKWVSASLTTHLQSAIGSYTTPALTAAQ